MHVDPDGGRASSPSEGAVMHRARIEFELAGGRPVGSIAVDEGRPSRFEGFDELERVIASIPSPHRPLVLVRSDDAPSAQIGLSQLTPREREIAVAAAGGASNREIAGSLYYSVKSVEAYLTRVYRKLGIAGRAELGELVEDLEVPDPVGDRLTGGRPGTSAGTGATQHPGPLARVELWVLPQAQGGARGPRPA